MCTFRVNEVIFSYFVGIKCLLVNVRYKIAVFKWIYMYLIYSSEPVLLEIYLLEDNWLGRINLYSS